VLVEHFILKGAAPLIFDTDAIERRLAACFPREAVVLDLWRCSTPWRGRPRRTG
jgi:hypothetical protein